MNKYSKFYFLLSIFYFLFFLSSLIHAQEYTSDSFILRDSVITIAGGRSSSESFEYYSSLGQLSSGMASGTSFTSRSGFLYFPVASTPVVSATAGNTQVSLTWTASVGTLANVTSYYLGIATASGGTYTYTSMGDVLSYIKTGLTNGTAYYFKIRSMAGTLSLVESAAVSATPAGTTASVTTTSGGGGGGGAAAVTAVNFSGRAYPKSTVTLLKDAQVAAVTVAGADSNFSISLTSLSAGSYIFSVYGEDNEGRRSAILSFPVSVVSGSATNVSGIFIAPTIAVDKSEVKLGDNIAIFGQSAAQSEITIVVSSDQQYFGKVNSDKNGIYLYNFDTSPLEMGQHFAKSKAALAEEISSYGRAVAFTVGDKNVSGEISKKCPAKGDVNNDCLVNLVDFSITAYWYQRPLSDSFKIVEKRSLSGDGKVDLVDFSIMAYYWTG